MNTQAGLMAGNKKIRRQRQPDFYLQPDNSAVTGSADYFFFFAFGFGRSVMLPS